MRRRRLAQPAESETPQGPPQLRCWHCDRVLTGTHYRREVLCLRCAAWGTPEALHFHGPVSNRPADVARRGGVVAPELDAYPAAFRRGYVP